MYYTYYIYSYILYTAIVHNIEKFCKTTSLEHLPKLPNICLNRDIKSVSKLYGKMIHLS
jgi:hypothetical protein